MTDARRAGSRLGVWLAKLAVSAALIGWLLSRPATRAAFGRLDGGTHQALALAVLLYAGCQLVSAARWWLLLRAAEQPIDYPTCARITFIGMFANFFLPTSIGGDVVRIGLLAPRGVAASVATLTVFLQRFCGLLAMVLIGAGGLLAGAAAEGAEKFGRLLATAASGALLGLAALALYAAVEGRLGLDSRLPRWLGRPLHRIGEAIRALARRPVYLAAVLAVSLAFQLGMVGLQALLAAAVGIDLPWRHWFWIQPLITLGEMIPTGPAGIGPREATAEFVLGSLGFAGQAVLASLLWQAMKLLCSLPGGLLWWLEGRPARRETNHE